MGVQSSDSSHCGGMVLFYLGKFYFRWGSEWLQDSVHLKKGKDCMSTIDDMFNVSLNKGCPEFGFFPLRWHGICSTWENFTSARQWMVASGKTERSSTIKRHCVPQTNTITTRSWIVSYCYISRQLRKSEIKEVRGINKSGQQHGCHGAVGLVTVGWHSLKGTSNLVMVLLWLTL